jgi:hypothetical protein
LRNGEEEEGCQEGHEEEGCEEEEVKRIVWTWHVLGGLVVKHGQSPTHERKKGTPPMTQSHARMEWHLPSRGSSSRDQIARTSSGQERRRVAFALGLEALR